VSNYYQMDLIKKNRWKDMEVVGSDKFTWILTSVMYIYFDYIFFYSAFNQCERLFDYLKQLEKEQELTKPESTTCTISCQEFQSEENNE